MKLGINKIKLIPKNLGKFGFCVYGDLSQEILDWSGFWKLIIEPSGKFTNIYLNDETNIDDIFETPNVYEYLDGFSPNLNKDGGFHLGHLSNFIIAKALQYLKISNKTIAILGDTLGGEKEINLSKYKDYCANFGYVIDDVFFASEQKLDGNYLSDGVGDYVGTKIFDINDTKIVGLKSDGSTSYFYQDVGLASKLNAATLYITGLEQNQHFNNLKFLFPKINHIGLGLVTVDGKKMSSSEGNVHFMEDIIKLVDSKFNNLELTWNVLAGHILKYDLPSMKDINLAQIDNVKTSQGLYLSYTMARLKSAGMVPNIINGFISKVLQFMLLRTKILISPKLLFTELVELSVNINKLYIDHHIKDNEENKKIFQPLLDDLNFGMNLLGMFSVDKV